MNDKGDWWYDRLTAVGATIDPSVNADMISPAFGWLKPQSSRSRVVMTPITRLF